MHFQLLNRTRPAIAFQLAVIVYHELYPKHDTDSDVREERDMQSKIHMQILNLPHVQAAARGVARVAKFGRQGGCVITEAKRYLPYLGPGTGWQWTAKQ